MRAFALVVAGFLIALIGAALFFALVEFGDSYLLLACVAILARFWPVLLVAFVIGFCVAIGVATRDRPIARRLRRRNLAGDDPAAGVNEADRAGP